MRKATPDPQIEGLTDEIRGLSKQVAALKGERDATKSLRSLEDESRELRERIETLKIEAARKEEEHARKIRDTEHTTGLYRKQSEWERTKAVDEARITVREENLSAERARFEEQMDFHLKQISGEVERFEGLLKAVLERLPTVSVEKSVELTGSARR